MKKKAWKKLERKIERCNKCNNKEKTCGLRRFGTHPIGKKVMVVAESPSFRFLKTSEKPVMGRQAYQELVETNLIGEYLMNLGLDSRKVFFTNIVKCPCRGAGDLEPYLKHCKKYFFKQLRLLKPKVVVTLGRFAASVLHVYILNKLHWRRHRKVRFAVVPVYHPSYLDYRGMSVTRDMRRNFKKLVIEGLKGDRT